jgi:NADPH-dependent 2,4-dienoyl-CoA reductase/sulfur reductase-like enzyme
MACYPDRYARRRIRIEHWRVAQQQGRSAARNMLGPELPYDHVPFFWTRQFGVSLTSAGYTDQWEDVILTGEPDELNFSAYYIKDGSIQAIAGTQTDRTITFMEQMRTGRLPAPEELADRGVSSMTN